MGTLSVLMFTFNICATEEKNKCGWTFKNPNRLMYLHAKS
jgi:hypothetical protein